MKTSIRGATSQLDLARLNLALLALAPLTLILLAGLAVAEPAAPPAEKPLIPAAPELALADDDIGLIRRIHFATHTPDFDKARAFYRMLGYTDGISGFPLSNTHLMARALGMFDLCQYELVKGEVIELPGSLNTASIDLLQFKTPFDGRPPYARPNHLGAAYSALLTTDLAHDVAFMKSRGVQFLSEPYGVPGDRFVFFRDPDGVLFELVQLSRERAGLKALAPGETTQGFMTQAVLALSDVPVYPAPMAFQLKDFTQVQASVFQVARAPGRNIVYLGCALLILGVFAMLYVRERRVWVWLAPAGTGAQATLALSSNRQTLDTDKEFEMLKTKLIGTTP